MTNTDTISFTDALSNMATILLSLSFSPLVIFLAAIGFILLLARKAF